MKAYRVGRKPAGTWINMTPPIRGGIYRTQDSPSLAGDAAKYLRDEKDDLSDCHPGYESDRGSSISFTFKCSGEEAVDAKTKPVLRKCIRMRDSCTERISDHDVQRHSPTDAVNYTELIVQQDIDQDIKDYPSLDPAVQQEIARKYRVLHQRVHDEGFYNCPYVEYGKEAARYITLFALFLLALRQGWYMVSAAFLGLFWVRYCSLSRVRALVDRVVAPNYVHCARCWT